jgi:hypothetical protein
MRQQPPRSRRDIEDDLHGLPVLRARLRTGDLRADTLFTEMIDRRTDRLLDELLRRLETDARRELEPAGRWAGCDSPARAEGR